MKRSSRRYHSTLRLLNCMKMRRLVAHPGTNRGVLKPPHEFSFDALRFTYHFKDVNCNPDVRFNQGLDSFMASLDLSPSDFIFQGVGGDFYRDRYYSEKYDMYMFFHPNRPEMGVHFKMMGNGCRLFFLTHTIEQFVKAVSREDVRFSRIDVALDDYSGKYFTPRRLEELDREGLISTRWNRVDAHFPRKAGGKQQFLEETIYFGSLKNETHLRVYNKYLEELGRFKKTEEEFKAEGISSWIRWELTLQGKSANTFIKLLFDSDFELPKIMLGVLSSKFRIIVPDATRATRCSSDPLWLDFVETDNVIQISRQRPQSELAGLLNWFALCMLPSFVSLNEILPDVMMELYDHILQTGRYRRFEIGA